MENLQRNTVSGLRHICDLLGATESEEEAQVAEMVSCDGRFGMLLVLSKDVRVSWRRNKWSTYDESGRFMRRFNWIKQGLLHHRKVAETVDIYFGYVHVFTGAPAGVHSWFSGRREGPLHAKARRLGGRPRHGGERGRARVGDQRQRREQSAQSRDQRLTTSWDRGRTAAVRFSKGDGWETSVVVVFLGVN